ncbi:MAG: DUF2975 domain-containing protein [Acetatifactor sp.]
MREKKYLWTKITKYLLDGMYFGGMLVTVTLPFSLKWIGEHYLPGVSENLIPALLVYVILGILAVLLIGELRKMFRTVLEENCFVRENVRSLNRMSVYAACIAVMSVVRMFVYATLAMCVVILVFVIAGLFSRVLAMVFDQAVTYKEENDLTI